MDTGWARAFEIETCGLSRISCLHGYRDGRWLASALMLRQYLTGLAFGLLLGLPTCDLQARNVVCSQTDGAMPCLC